MRCLKATLSCFMSALLVAAFCFPSVPLAYAVQETPASKPSSADAGTASQYTLGGGAASGQEASRESSQESGKGFGQNAAQSESSATAVPAVPSSSASPAVPSVGASADRTVNVKTDFDAKGDGKTDDTAALNRALRTAVSTAGTLTVVVPAGTYIISDSLGIYSNTNLQLASGAIMKSTAQDGSMLSGRHLDASGAICYTDSCTHGGYSQIKNITVSGGTWDRNDAKGRGASYGITLRHASDITVKNATFTNSVDHMLNLSANKNAKVENCTFKNSAWSTNYQSSFWDLTIGRTFNPNNTDDYNNRHRFSEVLHFDFTNYEGESRAYPIDNTPCENCTVTNCTFENVHSGVGTHHDNPKRSKGLKIVGCTFKNVFGRCVNVQCFDDVEISDIDANSVGGLLWSDDSKVSVSGTNNTVSCVTGKTAVNAIQAQNKTALTIAARLVLNNPGISGVLLSDASSLKNTAALVVNRPARFGVRVIGKSTATLDNVTVESAGEQGLSVSDSGSKLTARKANINKSVGAGLYADSGAVLDIDDSAITNSKVGAAFSGSGNGCVVRNTKITGSSSNGVQVTASSGNLTLDKNTISDSAAHGVYIANETNGKTITVSNNTITNPGEGKSGVSVSASSNAAITGNNISGMSSTGFGVIASGSAKVNVANNTITGNVDKKTPKYGVLLTDCAANSEVKSNNISSTYGPGIAITRTNNAKVTGNTIKDSYDNGIVVTDSSGATVSGNTSTSKYSVNADIRINNGVTGSTVSNNVVGGRGISANPNSKVTITNNKEPAAPLAPATISAIANQSYTGKAITPKPVVKLSGKTLKEGTDYTLSYKNNVNIGTATVTVTGKGNYTGTKSATFKIVRAAAGWTRLKGSSALDTMKVISSSAFAKSNVVVVATSGGFADALAASALAGRYNAPVLMTAPSSLSGQTRAEVARLGAKTAYVVGGRFAVSDKVMSQLKAAGCTTVTRVKGSAADDTSREIAKAVGTARSRTVIVATSLGYEDALSVSPYAYATKSPIILTNAKTGKLSAENVAWIKSAGFDRAIVVGGRFAVPTAVEDQLKGAGIAAGNIERLRGASAYDTSVAIAQWAVGNGMSANGMGVATGLAYADALAGAALCGSKGSVLLLADGKNSKVAVDFAKANKGSVSQGYVFGGKFAVPEDVLNKLKNATA